MTDRFRRLVPPNSDVLSKDCDECLVAAGALFESLRGARLLVTGGTGFFGCWLLETFLRANRRLALQARLSVLTRDAQKFRAFAPHLADDPAVDLVIGDVRNFVFPAGAFSHVVHAATESSAELNQQQPRLMFDTIVDGTAHALDFAQQAGVTKFLFLSSGAVYGRQPAELSQVAEDFAGAPNALSPASAYAEGKRAAEFLCATASGFDCLIARPFAFVGPYMKLEAHFAIGNFLRDRLAGRAIQVSGDGRPLRSYMYASDLAWWLWTILLRGAPLRPYNVGSEEAVTIADLAHTVASLDLGPTIPPCAVEIHGTPTAGPAPRYIPSTARAQSELALRCSVSLAESIRRTARWFQPLTCVDTSC